MALEFDVCACVRIPAAELANFARLALMCLLAVQPLRAVRGVALS